MSAHDTELRRLRIWNIAAAILHGASAVVMLAIANDFAIPITAAFADGPPGTRDVWPAEAIVSPPMAWLTASFLALSCIFHLLVALPGVVSRYNDALRAERAPFRWLEYTLSSSVMLVPIALLVGIQDVAALVAIVGCNMAMIWFGQVQEVQATSGGRFSWQPFVFGCLAGLVPWIAITIYLVGPGAGAPGFVYGIFISLFVFFNVFGLVMFGHYRGWRPVKRYLDGERAYIVLSFTAKSALAWQVFAGALAT